MAEPGLASLGVDLLPEGHGERIDPEKEGGDGKDQMEDQGRDNEGRVVRRGLSILPPPVKAHIEFKNQDCDAQNQPEKDLYALMELIVPALPDQLNADEHNGDNDGHGQDQEIEHETRSARGQETFHSNSLFGEVIIVKSRQLQDFTLVTRPGKRSVSSLTLLFVKQK